MVVSLSIRVFKPARFQRTFRDYYASLLRTMNSYVAPTQGKLLNYVQRVPLGVVAQITVRVSTKWIISFSFGPSSSHSTIHS
jgi:acyl-CoA reductase-like NAD-dependent aldehyde dehydrogenase